MGISETQKEKQRDSPKANLQKHRTKIHETIINEIYIEQYEESQPNWPNLYSMLYTV